MATHKEGPADQLYGKKLQERLNLIFLCLVLAQCLRRTTDVYRRSRTIFRNFIPNSCICDHLQAEAGNDSACSLSVKHIFTGNSLERKPPPYLSKGTVHEPVYNNLTDNPHRAIRKIVIQYYTVMFFNRHKLDAYFQKTSANTSNIIVRNTIGALIWIICIAFFLSSQRKRSNKYHFYETYHSTKRTFLNLLSKKYEFVFKLNGVPRASVQIFPFSINQYVDEIVKQNRSGEDLMKFEWSRYLSFKTFPMDSVMTPMRLAQAGFFYTGQGQQVKCFCCGVTNSEWTTEETAVEVHKRFSPNCRFIHSEDTDNVEIHNKEYYNGMFDVTSHPTNSRSASGASGGPNDAINNSPCTEINRSPASVQLNNGCGNSPLPQRNTGSGNSPLPQRNTGSGRSDSFLAAPAQKQPSCQVAANTEEPKKPMKHPHYADVATRIATFTTWTLMDIQDPAELAQAGFLYTGVKDFVRCYYCGVGLKNWERGDSPWAEHTHWSSSCPHLLNSRAAGGAMGDDKPKYEGNNGSADSVKQTETSISRGGSDKNASGGSDKKTSGEPDKGTGASGSSDMDSDAARSLLEMGYSHEQVTSAVQKFRDTNKSKPPHATALVEILEYQSSSEENASSSSTASNSLSTAVSNSLSSSVPSSMSTVDQSTVEQSMANMSISNKERQTPPARGKQAKARHTGNSNGEESLVEENRVLKGQMQCKICMDSEVNVVFLPCGHMVACQTCAMSLRKCAVCRKIIKGSVRVFQS